ncbi:hypothetical protein B0T25DRAFT_100510 [Lasiosphaeria hispida]|uniref:Uncharacterized protein n=1 Tax=Lasiosphaeria hispida TaxID=260671 RepID=A0AAJ0HQH3_9PEZI|nr:hypothetical protein B0T25DRAFT_100510 [Lasiosphaeria hispida]
MSSPTPADPYPAFDLFLPLITDSTADWKIKNAPPGPDGAVEAHRVNLTGYDRVNATCVRGRLFHVAHGVIGSGSTRPATLVVFEWLLVPQGGQRFREVEIDVTFRAHGRRPGTLEGADHLSEYTPEVRAVAPSVPVKSYISGREVQVEHSVGGKLTVGYAPFVSAGPEAARKKTEKTDRTDFRFVAGYPAYVDKKWGEPNSVHWTLQENGPQESGLPHLVRTAVLLQRKAGDAKGMFGAKIKTSADVSAWENAVQSLHKMVGAVPKDDPVYFDPKPAQGVTHGAAVLYGSREVANVESPFDQDNLGKEDLAKFLVPDDDEKWRVMKTSAPKEEAAEEKEPEPEEDVDLDWDLEL